ncbi:MAG: helix-turn-helix domain-containing protein [Cetobacterium sp.]
MYITSRHLQIFKFIKKNKDAKVTDIVELFNLSPQHIKLYLEDIYSEIYKENPSALKTNLILEKIYLSSNGRTLLKREQCFSKNEKIFYILFQLIKSKNINLSSISEELYITKRNLNYYLKDILSLLNEYHLKIITTNKGLKIYGSKYSLKKLSYYIVFKFLIEKNFLPTKIREDMLCFFKIKNFYKLRKDLYSFLNIINCNTTNHNLISFFTFFIVFKGDDKEQKIEDLDISASLKYKPIGFNNEFFFKIIFFLKTSSFKDLSLNYISEFLALTSFFHTSSNKFHVGITKQTAELRGVFAKYLGDYIFKHKNFYNLVNTTIHYCNLKKSFNIDDSSFLDLNLRYISNSKISKLTKDVRNLVPNFTIFDGLLLWYQLAETEDKNIKNVFVFKNINTEIIPILINEIYKKHNIIITDSIYINHLNNYLESNHVDNIITIENLNFCNKTISIKNIFFPIPN